MLSIGQTFARLSFVPLYPQIFPVSLQRNGGCLNRQGDIAGDLRSNSPAAGGDEQNRTVDPLLARQVLSQLSYAPVFRFVPLG